jgi:crotonobetainyl-CoA:carnitine CoA-transferase CaiB-like acyl-CoA transferase
LAQQDERSTGSGNGPQGPLAGLRVVDFSQAAAGPVSLMHMAMLGADVIKVESPRGDLVRFAAPLQKGMSSTFLGNNLRKKGVVFDLKAPAGLEAAKALLRTADVALDNFRSKEVMEKLGLGYDTVRALNPRIIYVQSSGYGRASQFQGMASHEWLAQAVGGFAGATGPRGGRFEESRGTAYFDWFAALVNLQAILVGLQHRRQTGEGMLIETSQYAATLCAGFTRFAEYLCTGDVPLPFGSERQNLVPDLVTQVADGRVAISAPTPESWEALAAMVGKPEWSSLSVPDRVALRDEINDRIKSAFSTWTVEQAVSQMQRVGVPCGRVFTSETVSEILRYQAELEGVPLIEQVSSAWGPLQVSAPVWRFSRSTLPAATPPPGLGEHQSEIEADADARSADD